MESCRKKNHQSINNSDKLLQERFCKVSKEKITRHTRSVGRVGNSLFGFLCELLVFCEQKSEILIRIAPETQQRATKQRVTGANRSWP